METTYFFNRIAYLYYPKNLYEFDDAFFETEEYKRYYSKIKSNNLSIILKKIIKKIDLEIKPLKSNIYETLTISPSEVVQIDLTKNKQFVVSIYFSKLIPFYFITILNGDIINKKVSRDLEAEKEYEYLIMQIKNIICNETYFICFCENLIDNKIDYIKINNNFTYYNAFFADYYRIKDF